MLETEVPPLLRQRYPRALALGELTLELRVMGRACKPDVLHFARGLPGDDLVFLPRDITEDRVVERWIADIEGGRTVTLLAYEGGRVLGEGTLHHHGATWTRHLGEVRLLVAEGARGRGLGRTLIDELYIIAKDFGLQMLTAQMSLEQEAAQAVFRRLGFQREAVLWDYIIDGEGRRHNLLITTKYL